jgi:hypothetical protein
MGNPGLNRKHMKLFLLALALALACATMSQANAASSSCPAEYRTDLQLAARSIKEAGAYADEGQPDLASASMSNASHSLDMVSRDGDCPDVSWSRMFFDLSWTVNKDQFQKPNGNTDQMVLIRLEILNLDMRGLYANGSSIINPDEYGSRKQFVKAESARLHVKFESWENTTTIRTH